MPSFLYTCVFVPSPHPCAPSIMWVLESNLEFQFIRLDGKCPYPLSHLASSGWPRFCFLKTQLIFFYQTLINRSTCNLNFTNAHTLPESKDLKLSQACPLPLNRWWWHMHQYLKQMPILPGGFFFFLKVSLYSPSYPQIYDPPASASQATELQVKTTMPSCRKDPWT